MPSIFDGLDDIIDDFLHVDENWDGQAPRYHSRTTLLRLCTEHGPDIDGVGLVHALYEHMLKNWAAWDGAGGLPTEANWRFEKRIGFDDANMNPETLLERTIALVTDDDNWANQVPVDSGLLGSRPHWIDLVFRAGSAFSLIELKYESNTPLSAAFQVLRYGLAYVFSRSHAEVLGFDPHHSPLFEASEIHLRVLAPLEFFTAYGPDLAWLSRFESAIQDGLESLAQDRHEAPPLKSFRFEAFPEDFKWTYQAVHEAETQKQALWAIHQREQVFGN
jgi:hypothetical protein